MKYSTCSRTNKLVEEALSRGWTFQPKGKNKHPKLVHPTGHKLPIAISPRCPRAALNLAMEIRHMEKAHGVPEAVG